MPTGCVPCIWDCLRRGWRPYCLLMTVCCGGPAAAESPAAGSFAAQVAPILQQHCVRCHGPLKQEAGLRLDDGPHALAGGDSGPAIQPGRSGDSPLLQRVSSTDAELVMPPEGARLADDDVAALRTWIDEGAHWPANVVLQVPDAASPGREHWAFQQIRRPATPVATDREWGHNVIDAFVLHRLEAEGLSPSPAADRATLIRRVTLDLVGLPPTLAEVDAFINDDAPGAFDRLVDRLLASPQYGERWARPWLDLCHYGDSDGYLTDQLRPVAWRYRAWLVDALNCDLPFDEFTVEQLAGDLLPGATDDQRLATGFLRQTLSNREGGADLEEFRVAQVVDRTTLVGTVWLGLTLGCARCHSHKYDPINQREFFQLYAFFDNADEVNIDAPLPGELEPYRLYKPTYDERRRALLAPIAKELEQLQKAWEAKLLYAAAHPGEDYRWDRHWEVLGLIWGGQLGEGQLEGCEIVKLPWEGRTQDQQERLQEYFLMHGAPVDAAKFQELKLSEVSSALEAMRRELPPVTRAPVMRAALTFRTSHVHVRGDFRVPGGMVQPGTPEFLPPLAPAAGAGDGAVTTPDRVQLARWLVSPENPLTPRVTVNRMWQELFGRGLVLTSGDFGTLGSKPTHPELLDWLATELIARQWSIKAMHRLIVTSATYQQSSDFPAVLRQRDPENLLLGRQSSLRLSAEQVRDGALAVSGLLDTTIGGPSVRPPQPDSVTMEGFGENAWEASTGPDRYRRGLYTFLQRTSPFAQLVTFDGPQSSEACTRRERSNTPLQALTLLNDPVFLEAAQHLALRVQQEASGGVAEHIEHGFRLCTGRAPTTAERERLLAYFRQQRDFLEQEPQNAQALVSQGVETGRENRPAESGAWVGVGTVLLNLHEFITRP